MDGLTRADQAEDPRSIAHRAFLYAWQAGREFQLTEDTSRLEALVDTMRGETP